MIGAREISEYAQKYNMELGKDTPLSMEWCFKMADKAYEKGRSEGYSKAENDYFKKNEEILKQQFDNGENYGYYKGRADMLKEVIEIVESIKRIKWHWKESFSNEQVYEEIVDYDKLIESLEHIADADKKIKE